MEWYTLVLLSSLLMGAETVIAKNTLRKEHATEFSAALNVLVAIVSLLFIPFADFGITLTQVAFLVVLSALSAYTYLLSSRIFRHGELSVASPAFSSLPTLFVVVLSFFFLNEQLKVAQYISIVGMVVATYMLFFKAPKRKDGKKTFDGVKYEYMILVYVVLSAIGAVAGKYVLNEMNPYTYLIGTGIFMSVFLTIIITVRYKGISEIVEAVKKYRLPLVTNTFLTLGYRVTFFVALAVAPVSLAQPLRNVIYVVLTVVLGCCLFKEDGLWRKLALSVIMLAFAYMLTL